MKKRSICAFIAVLLLFSFTVAYAQDNSYTPYASEVLGTGAVSLSFSGNTLRARCTLSAKGVASQIGIMKLWFQKYVNGSWTNLGNVTNYIENSASYAAVHTWPISSSGKYRAKCIFYAMVNGESDEMTCYSATITK